MPEGELEVSQNGQVLGNMNAGKAFGELAILYNCTRTASVKGMLSGSHNVNYSHHVSMATGEINKRYHLA